MLLLVPAEKMRGIGSSRRLGLLIPAEKMRGIGSSPQLRRLAAIMFLCVLFFSFFLSAVEAQPGFLSLDCGLPEGEEYVENSTLISYIADGKYVQGGQPKRVKADDFPKRYETLRAFPEGDRNCYDLRPLQAGSKYLVRAGFFYGNYDGLSTPPEFELHIGIHAKLSIFLDLNETSLYEVVTVANGNRIWACLANTGKGSPIISVIELRPLLNLSYPANSSQSLRLQRRTNFGAQSLLRYPTDEYDRRWSPLSEPYLTINTSNPVAPSPKNLFKVPSIVMRTAITVPNVSFVLFFLIAVGLPTDTVFFVLHFAELQNITNSNETRIMDVFGLGNETKGLTNYSVPYLQSGYIVGEGLQIGPTYLYNISVSASNASTLPPILNALESFRVLKSDQLPTDLADVAAMEDIKAAYEIVRNWQGDPCVPEEYAWKGLTCSYAVSSASRIISLNLSSIGITGDLPSSIANLTALTSLDLSNNEISIKALDLLAKLPSLKTLNLSGVKILGSSQAFCNQALNGALSSTIQGLKSVCSHSESPSATPDTKPKDNSSVSKKINYFVSIIMLLLLSFAV